MLTFATVKILYKIIHTCYIIHTMKRREIFTIGYEGRNIDNFVSCLKAHHVTRLIDVREVPLSRKRGFSKSALKNKMESENIEYIHLRQLGSPSDIRSKLRVDHDYDFFFRAYSNHLSQNHEAIVKAYGYVADGINCLMCFERLANKCHRSAVAWKIKEYDCNGLIISHI